MNIPDARHMWFRNRQTTKSARGISINRQRWPKMIHFGDEFDIHCLESETHNQRDETGGSTHSLNWQIGVFFQYERHWAKRKHWRQINLKKKKKLSNYCQWDFFCCKLNSGKCCRQTDIQAYNKQSGFIMIILCPEIWKLKVHILIPS